jgi:hypothetical protein
MTDSTIDVELTSEEKASLWSVNPYRAAEETDHD